MTGNGLLGKDVLREISPNVRRAIFNAGLCLSFARGKVPNLKRVQVRKVLQQGIN